VRVPSGQRSKIQAAGGLPGLHTTTFVTADQSFPMFQPAITEEGHHTAPTVKLCRLAWLGRGIAPVHNSPASDSAATQRASVASSVTTSAGEAVRILTMLSASLPAVANNQLNAFYWL
jgi:hypothetical protein